MLKQGRLPEAESALTRALSAVPSLAKARATLGLVYMGQGRNQEAAQTLAEAVSLGENDVGIRLKLAVAYLKLRELSGAIDTLERVLADFPDHGRAHLLLAMCYASTERHDEANSHAARAEALGESIQALQSRLRRRRGGG